MDSEFGFYTKKLGESNRYDLLLFPEVNNNLNYKKDQDMVSYFTEKGHRVFYCNINNSNNKEKELINKELILITLNNRDLYYINRQLDEVIKQSKIKDCVLIVEDPSWQPIIAYLKKIYGFKVIFNYSQKGSLEKTNNLLLFEYDDTIFKISDEIIIFSSEIYKSGKIKNNRVNIIDSMCTAEYIESIIKKIHGLASVIIITFNNLNFTKQCIESILAKTAYPNYELIIVDNNSEDGTQDYLKELQKEYSNITVVLNDENYGFAKANNIGIRYSKGEYIILLNNDTVVTNGWVTGFVKHLDRDEKLGLVGPVTNGAYTESKIDVNYSSIKEMDAFAEEYTTHNFNQLYMNLEMLEMFCVAMKRKVIDEIGYLDESFGIGTFEDDDYCYRVKLKGYKIVCAEDVFIHHYVSASFEKLEYDQRLNNFYKNKDIYERKWGIAWKEHELRK